MYRSASHSLLITAAKIMLLVILFFILAPGLVLGKVVVIKDGAVNGTVLTARRGNPFNAFLGIPYAKPPVGSLRFKEPEKAEPWNGTLDASFESVFCIQVSSGKLVGSEDCLYLNLFSPIDAKKGDKLPVIIYIFGGAFTTGSISENGPQYFMGMDIIMIQPSYRLGILGFVSTGDDVIPGNLGLKDQILALKWAQENVEYFGGDPDHVTLMGHSSGASCAHLHTLSPLSKGLFHKVILQSSVGGMPSALFGPDVAKAVAKKFATGLGCNASSSENILTCFMNMKAEALAIADEHIQIWDKDPEAVPKPVIEGKGVKNAFLSDNPRKLKYHSPEQTWLIGFTTEEAAYKVARYLGNGGGLAEDIDKHHKALFPIIMQYYFNTKHEDLDYISDSLRSYYFGTEKICENVSTQFVQLLSDGMFSYYILDVMKTYPGNRFAYLFNYKSNYTTQNAIGYYPKSLGISHTSEIHMMFLRSESYDKFTKEDVEFADEMILRWVNFVTSGNPNYPNPINEKLISYWKPVITEKVEYLRLNVNGSMETGLLLNDFPFWRTLPIGNKYA